MEDRFLECIMKNKNNNNKRQIKQSLWLKNNQTEFEKNGWKGYNNLFNGWINKK